MAPAGPRRAIPPASAPRSTLNPGDLQDVLYSLAGSERVRTLHGGIGFEVAASGGTVAFAVGDYCGRSGVGDRVHDLHVTLMARLPGIGDLIRAATGSEEAAKWAHPPQPRRQSRS